MNMAKKTGKVVAAVLISLVWLILMVLTGLNCAKRFIYAEYYSNRKIVAKIPDLNRGFASSIRTVRITSVISAESPAPEISFTSAKTIARTKSISAIGSTFFLCRN